MTPPVVGPATRSTIVASSSPRPSAAKEPHSSLVAAGSWSTWNFSTYASPWRRLLSRKWPSRNAPELRNSDSVLRAMALRMAGSRAGSTVVITGVYAGPTETGMHPKPRRWRGGRGRRAALARLADMELLVAIVLLVTMTYLDRKSKP